MKEAQSDKPMPSLPKAPDLDVEFAGVASSLKANGPKKDARIGITKLVEDMELTVELVMSQIRRAKAMLDEYDRQLSQAHTHFYEGK